MNSNLSTSIKGIFEYQETTEITGVFYSPNQVYSCTNSGINVGSSFAGISADAEFEIVNITKFSGIILHLKMIATITSNVMLFINTHPVRYFNSESMIMEIDLLEYSRYFSSTTMMKIEAENNNNSIELSTMVLCVSITGVENIEEKLVFDDGKLLFNLNQEIKGTIRISRVVKTLEIINIASFESTLYAVNSNYFHVQFTPGLHQIIVN